MTAVLKACDLCGNRTGHGPVEAAICALRRAIADEAKAYAATLDKPPADVAVIDLLAHLNIVYQDGELARWAIRKVLDMGWRPVVGESS